MTSNKLGTGDDLYASKSYKGLASSIPIHAKMQSTHTFLPPPFPRMHLQILSSF